MISLDVMKSSEVRKAGDQSKCCLYTIQGHIRFIRSHKIFFFGHYGCAVCLKILLRIPVPDIEMPYFGFFLPIL